MTVDISNWTISIFFKRLITRLRKIVQGRGSQDIEIIFQIDPETMLRIRDR